MKAKIKKLTPQYENYSSLFHTKAEVEGLYQTLSEFAGANDLVITKIEKKEIKPILSSAVLQKKVERRKRKRRKRKREEKNPN